jgi:dTDP-4-dehydrorhamnose 3,5-epimerase
MIDVRPLALDGVLELTPKRYGDHRGFFSETYKASAWAEAGVAVTFVQDNQSFSRAPFTLRGLHFQSPPPAQDKLVRVARGRIWDVAVDLRRGSPTFSAWVAVEISAEKGNQLLVPKGFAHGLLTLEPDCEVVYKTSAEFSPAHDVGVAWDDPTIGVEWPLNGARPVLSEKDAKLPRLAEIEIPFEISR